VNVNQLVVGIDIGGSKTRMQGCLGGEVVADVTVSSRRVLSGDDATTAAALVALVRDWLGGVGTPSALAVGAHGCDTTEQCRALQAEIAARIDVPARVVNDAELVLPAAGLAHGAAVIAGTGSIAVGYGDGGDLLVAGGWGWILGDEGSAAGLVREAAREALARADRGESPDALTLRLERAFDVADLSYLSQTMARHGGASAWGEHARQVFLAADAGARSAATVIERAGADLASLVVTLRDRGADVRDVVTAGGVITAQPRLEQAFRTALGTVLPTSRLRVLREPPVTGAARLAAGLLGDPDTTLTAV
jgi:N-acetylglucosamine kinase-like BadF-type ATPase